MGWLDRLFGGSKSRKAAEALLAAVSDASREPRFFGADGAPNTLEGRLELLTLHGVLLLTRLSGEAERTLAQEFTDILFRHIDSGLREAGVGDLSVPRRMRKIASQFYGRLEAYRAALDDDAALTEALTRNIFGGHQNPFAATLAAHARRTHVALAETPTADLTAGHWPLVTA